jgi:hypothetical protein
MKVIDSIHKLYQEPKRALSGVGKGGHCEVGRELKERRCVLQDYAERGAQSRPIWCY